MGNFALAYLRSAQKASGVLLSLVPLLSLISHQTNPPTSGQLGELPHRRWSSAPIN